MSTIRRAVVTGYSDNGASLEVWDLTRQEPVTIEQASDRRSDLLRYLAPSARVGDLLIEFGDGRPLEVLADGALSKRSIAPCENYQAPGGIATIRTVVSFRAQDNIRIIIVNGGLLLYSNDAAGPVFMSEKFYRTLVESSQENVGHAMVYAVFTPKMFPRTRGGRPVKAFWTVDDKRSAVLVQNYEEDQEMLSISNISLFLDILGVVVERKGSLSLLWSPQLRGLSFFHAYSSRRTTPGCWIKFSARYATGTTVAQFKVDSWEPLEEGPFSVTKLQSGRGLTIICDLVYWCLIDQQGFIASNERYGFWIKMYGEPPGEVKEGEPFEGLLEVITSDFTEHEVDVKLAFYRPLPKCGRPFRPFPSRTSQIHTARPDSAASNSTLATLVHSETSQDNTVDLLDSREPIQGIEDRDCSETVQGTEDTYWTAASSLHGLSLGGAAIEREATVALSEEEREEAAKKTEREEEKEEEEGEKGIGREEEQEELSTIQSSETVARDEEREGEAEEEEDEADLKGMEELREEDEYWSARSYVEPQVERVERHSERRAEQVEEDDLKGLQELREEDEYWARRSCMEPQVERAGRQSERRAERVEEDDLKGLQELREEDEYWARRSYMEPQVERVGRQSERRAERVEEDDLKGLQELREEDDYWARRSYMGRQIERAGRQRERNTERVEEDDLKGMEELRQEDEYWARRSRMGPQDEREGRRNKRWAEQAQEDTLKRVQEEFREEDEFWEHRSRHSGPGIHAAERAAETEGRRNRNRISISCHEDQSGKWSPDHKDPTLQHLNVNCGCMVVAHRFDTVEGGHQGRPSAVELFTLNSFFKRQILVYEIGPSSQLLEKGLLKLGIKIIVPMRWSTPGDSLVPVNEEWEAYDSQLPEGMHEITEWTEDQDDYTCRRYVELVSMASDEDVDGSFQFDCGSTGRVLFDKKIGFVGDPHGMLDLAVRDGLVNSVKGTWKVRVAPSMPLPSAVCWSIEVLMSFSPRTETRREIDDFESDVHQASNIQNPTIMRNGVRRLVRLRDSLEELRADRPCDIAVHANAICEVLLQLDELVKRLSASGYDFKKNLSEVADNLRNAGERVEPATVAQAKTLLRKITDNKVFPGIFMELEADDLFDEIKRFVIA